MKSNCSFFIFLSFFVSMEMGASTESSLTKYIKSSFILSFIFLFLLAVGRYIYEPKDQNRCHSMLNEGWWVDDTLKSWQPASCMMHTYRPPEISACLNHSRIVYVGDSVIREQFFSAVKLIDPHVNTTGEPHTNKMYDFNKENLVYEFWWDPYLNETTNILRGSHTPRPSLLVLGTGLWQMRYLQDDDYYEKWKSSIDRVLESVESRDIADTVLLAPVEVPVYDKLGEERAAKMTVEKVNAMNDYLKAKQDTVNARVPFAIPFVWNGISLTSSNHTQDGLHFSPAVTTVQAQIALNFRCNNQLDKKFPMTTTCCYQYPVPKWYQNVLFFFFFIWIPVGCLVLTHSGITLSAIQRPFPEQKVSSALFLFGLCTVYMYFCDRTQLFGKIQKHFDATVFTALMMVVGVLGFIKLKHKTEGDQGFLNRHQTDEWKGWMQVIILIYHFCGASGTSGIYNAVRILVAAYLFQTGYGHFFFFYKKADFGIGRILNVMVRLNLLTFVLQYLMDTDYLSYYFTPLVSFWFFVIWTMMYIGNQWNKTPSFLLAKLAVSCILTTAFIKVPGILEFVFDILQVTFNIHWNPAEWRFRLALVTEHPKWPIMKKTALGLSVIALVWYFWFELSREDKFAYNQVHPYISWIPILGFVVLRNANAYLRNTHSEFYSFIGKISLETFIGQFHMWLAADTKGLLVLLINPAWIHGIGWWVNLAFSSCLFVFVCYYLGQTTHEISTWICAKAQPDTPSSGKYQAVPLLPTNKGDSSNTIQTVSLDNTKPEEEVGEEEIWSSSDLGQKPGLFQRILNDTRVRVLLFFTVMSLVNHLCE
ncbi:Putative CAS1 domain-containing protein [Rhizopus microsporus]|nr:Putative CAS1 domain-containing protein [Rhizopus microsporus]